MLYSASSRRRRTIQRSSSRRQTTSRGSSRGGSLASPPGSACRTNTITISEEPWPDTNVTYDNDYNPVFQINEPKPRNPLERIIKRASFRAPFSNPIISNPHRLGKHDPQNFVMEEKERVDEIRDLMNAKDYDTALKNMLSDTDGDYHYYNKVKNETMAKKHDEAFARRHGKLRRSIDETQTFDHRQCLWHGKTDRGFPLRCHNNCLNHPHDKIINHLGKPYPRPLDFCSYHVRYCVETVKHGDMPIKIRVQNELALCNECYVLKTNAEPPILNRIPGTRRKRECSYEY